MPEVSLKDKVAVALQLLNSVNSQQRPQLLTQCEQVMMEFLSK